MHFQRRGGLVPLIPPLAAPVAGFILFYQNYFQFWYLTENSEWKKLSPACNWFAFQEYDDEIERLRREVVSMREKNGVYVDPERYE